LPKSIFFILSGKNHDFYSKKYAQYVIIARNTILNSPIHIY